MKILKLVFYLILFTAIGRSDISAQSIGESTFAVGDSKLTGTTLPNGARQLKEEYVPQEIKSKLSELAAAGGDKVKQGRSEIIVWDASLKKNTGQAMTERIETGFKNDGWEYEVGERNSEGVLFSLFRKTPQAKLVLGFIIPTKDLFIVAMTEMVRADALSAEKPNADDKATVSSQSQTVKSKDDLSIYGKWYRGTGSGFIDYTGKTRYKSGESFYFEFFPNGAVEFTKTIDVLSIVQCKIKGEDKARGKFTISGDQLTIDLDAMSSWETNSCDSSKNFKKTVPASSTTVRFEIKKMDSITRPDNPLTLCFNGKDGSETCYELEPQR